MVSTGLPLPSTRNSSEGKWAIVRKVRRNKRVSVTHLVNRGILESGLSVGRTVHLGLLIQELVVPSRPIRGEPGRSRQVVLRVRRTMLPSAIRSAMRATRESGQSAGVSVLQDSMTLEPSARSQPPMGEVLVM